MEENNLLTLGVFLLVFACFVSAIMVARGDGDTRRLEGRIKSLHGTSGPAVGPKVPVNIRRSAPGGSLLVRLLEKIGRSRHVPAERRLPWPVGAVLAAAVGSAAGYVALKVLGPSVAPFAGGGAGLFAARSLFRWEAARYQHKLFQQVPDSMGLILRAIRAGLPMGEALANVARELSSPSKEEFSQVVNNIAIGQPIDQALFGLAERSGLAEYYFFAVTVGLQAQSGGNLAETLDNLADMVRKRVAMAGKVKAMTGEARVSAIILSVLPFAVGGLINVLKPGHVNPLFQTDLGFRLLLVGATLLTLGLLAIRWLMKNASKD